MYKRATIRSIYFRKITDCRCVFTLSWRVFPETATWVFYKKRFSEKFYKACSFIKKETLAKAFSRKFCKIFKSSFFTEHPKVTTSAIPNI